MRNSNAMTVNDGRPGKQGVELAKPLDSLRQKLYRKAKSEPKFRFYTLYNHIHREDVLAAAWKLVKRNGGAPGVDGISIALVKESGEGEFLKEIQQELQAKKYKPQPIKRVYIEKPDGGKRPLGIPTVKDRTIQAAVRLIIEPIFEADFEDTSYGFRPGRSQHDALAKVQEHLKAGARQVYDIDLKGYFDSVPHDKLMKCLQMRISDQSLLKLIRMWLKSPVIEEQGGGKKRTSRNDKGTPQGGVISPLLANVYLHWFDKVFRKQMEASGESARMVRYADDMLIFADNLSHNLCEFVRHKLEDWLELELNQTKTRKVELRDGNGSVDFLGFTFRFDKDLKGRSKHYLNTTPSAKSLKRERVRLKEMTDHSKCFVPIPQLISQINKHLKSWKPYYEFGYPRKAFRDISSYTMERLTKHLKRRSQRPFRPPAKVSYYEHLHSLGLQSI